MLTLVGAALAAGLVFTGAAFLLARRFGIMAIPNARSAHSVPVASIGGLGFVIPTLAWLTWSAAVAGEPFALVLAGGAVVLALVGLLDDLFDLSAGLRLPIHLVVAAATVAIAVDGTLIVLAICAIGLAWFVNLYNFMDGIDGIAGSQAAIFCLGALYFGGGGSFDATLWVLLASCAGFLCLNWAPARVIMGDTGSGFLGFTIGALAVYLWQTGTLPLLTSLILLAAFWFDATYTLAVRLVTRQRVAQAHNNHLYQKLARRWGHGHTTALLWGYAVVWLAPLATLYGRLELGIVWLVPACLPILAACVVFRAGLPDDTAHA